MDELKNWEVLSQVWFVHNYVQLQFHDEHTITVANPSSVKLAEVEYEKGEFGYADSLVGIIGSRVVGVDYRERSHLKLTFSCGTVFTIDLSDGVSNLPEAFELKLSDGPYIEFNYA